MVSVKQKLENFNNLCKNLVYENIDDDSARLERIDIDFKKGTIDIFFKKYSELLEEMDFSDYHLHVHEGPIKNKKLAREFINLDLSKKCFVKHYINRIERQVDFSSLYEKFEKKEKDYLESYFDYMDLENIEDPFFAQYGMTYQEAARELLY